MPIVISNPRSRRRARLEIIPLIDIMFFLLATFMMVSLAMIRNEGIPLQLPRAGSAERLESRATVTFSVNTAGQLFWDQSQISIPELRTRIVELKKVNADPNLVLQADQGADFGRVMEVLDLLRTEGLGGVTLRTQPPQPQ